MSLTFSPSSRNDLVGMQGNLGGGAAGVRKGTCGTCWFRMLSIFVASFMARCSWLSWRPASPAVRGPARAGWHTAQCLASASGFHSTYGESEVAVRTVSLQVFLPRCWLACLQDGPGAWVPAVGGLQRHCGPLWSSLLSKQTLLTTSQGSPGPCNKLAVECGINNYEKCIHLCWKGWICFGKTSWASVGFFFLFLPFLAISFFMWIPEFFLPYWSVCSV